MRSNVFFILFIYFSSAAFAEQVQTIYLYDSKSYYTKFEVEQALKNEQGVSNIKSLEPDYGYELKYLPYDDAEEADPYETFSPDVASFGEAVQYHIDAISGSGGLYCPDDIVVYLGEIDKRFSWVSGGRKAIHRFYTIEIELERTYWKYGRLSRGEPRTCNLKTYTHNKFIIQNQNYDCPDNDHMTWPLDGLESSVPICTNGYRNVRIKTCEAPYEWEESSLECVKYCPPGASTLDKILGLCKGRPVKNCASIKADPIETATGESTQPQSPDYNGSGTFPLRFSRNYKSFRAPEAAARKPPPPEEDDGTITWTRYVQPADYSGVSIPNWVNTSELGVISPTGFKQWMHSYQLFLVTYPDESKIVLVRANGDKLYFSVAADNVTYTPDYSIGDKIVKSGSNWLYTSPQGNSETYNDLGQLISITNNQGLVQTLAYDTNGSLLTITDPADRQLTLGYDTESRLSTLTDPNGKVTTYKYGNHGNLVKVIYPDDTPADATDNALTQYHYTDVNNPYALTQQIDENGSIYANWTFDSSGRATSSTNFEGFKQTLISYNNTDVSVTEANGHASTLTFDDKGRLSSATGGNCGQCGNSDITSYGYDTKNQLTSKTDFNGVETRYEYNTRGLQTKRTEAFGTTLARVTTTQWHADLSLPTKVTTPTQQVDYVYGVRGRLESITEKDLLVTENPTRVTTYTYNTTGLLLSINGARSDVSDTTTFAYNAQHDLISITDGVGNVTQITSFDAHGHPTTIVDANGVITTLAYDVRNRLISQTVAGNVTSFDYDNIGQLTKITLPSGAITNYEYSGARLLTQMSDGQGNSVNYTYDVMGNVTKIEVKDPASNLYATQQQVFDGLNRLTSQIDGLSQTTVFGYDAVGNQVSVKSPLLKETKQVYDALNRLSETTDAKLGKTTYGYDAANNLTLVKAPNNAQTTYSYDGFGNLLSQTSPDTGTTSFTYDVAGNQLSKTDAKNVTVNYRYDALNRLTGIDYPTDVLDVTLTYDTGTNGKGRLSQIADGSGTTVYNYNALGQVSSKTSTVLGKSFSLAYGYNGAGQLSQITQPSGRVVNLIRDIHGQVTGISELIGGTTQNLLTSASYVPFGSAKSLTLGNGKTTTKTHNLNGQLASIDVSGIYQSSLTYNSDSNITGLSNTVTPTANQTLAYDELDRLTEATGTYGTLGYSYDSASNRMTKTDSTQTSSLTYNAESNQLASPYFHDKNGNRTQDSKRTYSYGDNNRLTEVSNDDSGVKTTYLYNGLGQRVKKANVFGDVYFIYDEQGLLIAEADDTGGITKEYVYFEGQPLVMLVGE